MAVFRTAVFPSEEMQYFEQFSWERAWNVKTPHSLLVKETFSTTVILEMSKLKWGDVTVPVWTSTLFAVPQVSGKTKVF